MDNLDLNLELLASRFRQNNGLNSTEAIRIKSLLIKNNILTVYLPLSPDFSGMAVKLNEEGKAKLFVLVNSNHTIGRQHFTICHEIYHLYIQGNFKNETSIVGAFNKDGNIEEYKADIFASHLLLPNNGVLQLIPEKERQKNKISLKTILSIEHYYSCSRSALLIKLTRMKLIDRNFSEAYSVDKIKNALLYGYKDDLYQPGNEWVVIGDYGTLARGLFDEGVISESSYFSLLEDIGIDLSNYDNKADIEK